MVRKAVIALAAALAVGIAFIPTDSMAQSINGGFSRGGGGGGGFAGGRLGPGAAGAKGRSPAAFRPVYPQTRSVGLPDRNHASRGCAVRARAWLKPRVPRPQDNAADHKQVPGLLARLLPAAPA